MRYARQAGFSLVELSIVLIIIGTLVGGAVVPLSSSLRNARYKQTNDQLKSLRIAMHGYLMSTGKLPCPVDIDNAVLNNREKPVICTTSAGGVAAVDLGVVGERAANGALLDSWGRPYRYAVSMADNEEHGLTGQPDWLSVGELVSVGAQNLNADLQLCKQASTGLCSRNNLIADQIVWVIYSLGEHNDTKGVQIENQDDDVVFSVSSYSSHAEQPFDDQIVWASRSELVYWLLKANWLP